MGVSSFVSAFMLRSATYLFPPAGLFLLWRRPGKFWRKILGTFFIILFCIPYAALVIFLLVKFSALQIEWRGGYVPALTSQKTVPNYDTLERSRKNQSLAPLAEVHASATNAYWTGFRGPQRDGRYDEKPILTNWPASGLRLLWRQPIGGGYASFAIADGMAITIEQRREKEVTVAYALTDGREIWTNAWSTEFTEYYSDGGPRATPTYWDGKLYAYGALGELRCLDAKTGGLLWRHDPFLENQAMQPTYGVSSSPLVVDGKVIVQTGASQGHSMVCYDANDGKMLWHMLDDAMGYSSPMLATLAGQRQIIVSAGSRTLGLRVEDGTTLWEYPWRVQEYPLQIAQPVMLGTNRFFLSAGYFTGCAAVEISKTETGFSARTLWRNKNMKNKFTSSVFWRGHIYGLDEEVLVCLDANTGARKWKDGKYGYGQLLLASGHLVILSGNGDLALVKATPERYEEVARFPAIHGKTWNHPAMADGKILVRNAVEMAGFEIAP